MKYDVTGMSREERHELLQQNPDDMDPMFVSRDGSLADFLLARIAEDQSNDTTLIGVARKDWTARWLAECEAKRRIVEGMRDGQIDDMFAPEILGHLASVYSDHPDYREEWRP